MEIEDNCLGLVGINESGKSNLLYAINVLKEGRNLSSADTPKMEDKKHNPSLRFDFELTNDERKFLLDEILIWSESNTLVGKSIKKSTFSWISPCSIEESGSCFSFRNDYSKYQ